MARAAIWTIITTFSGIEMNEVLGDDINRIENVFTLGMNVHGYFGQLEIWLEGIQVRSASSL
jgi:hypothetical protein